MTMGGNGVCRQDDTRINYQASRQDSDNMESEQRGAESEKMQVYVRSSIVVAGSSLGQRRSKKNEAASVHSTVGLGDSIAVLEEE